MSENTYQVSLKFENTKTYDLKFPIFSVFENSYDLIVRNVGRNITYDLKLNIVLKKENFYDLLVINPPNTFEKYYDLIIRKAPKTYLSSVLDAKIENNQFIYDFIINDTKMLPPKTTIEYPLSTKTITSQTLDSEYIKTYIVPEKIILKWDALKEEHYNVLEKSLGRKVSFEYMNIIGNIIITSISYEDHIGVNYKKVSVEAYILLEVIV